MPASLLAPVLVILVLVGGRSPVLVAGMQRATSPVTLPATPSPAACTVAPRDPEALRALLGTPAPKVFPTTDPDGSATQMVEIPIGQPAGPEIESAVVATTNEFHACFNAGDMRRAFALVTDRYLQSHGDSGTLTTEDIAFLTGDPVTVPASERTALLAVTDVSLLVDGRVGAFVVTTGPFLGPDTGYMLFREHGGRWLVDEIVEFL